MHPHSNSIALELALAMHARGDYLVKVHKNVCLRGASNDKLQQLLHAR